MACPISSSNTTVNGTPVGVSGLDLTIATENYKTVWIGNKRWLAENLRGNLALGFNLNFKSNANAWSNTSANEAAWCYIDNTGVITPTTTNHCDQGSLYNLQCIQVIETALPTLLGPGWRVATEKDFSDAYALLNNSGKAALKLNGSNAISCIKSTALF